MLAEFLENIHKKFVAEEYSANEVFTLILNRIIEITKSEYGFIGIIKYDESNNPYLRTYHITDISWNEETKNLYEKNKEKGFEFRNLNTLFGWVMVNKKPLLTNDAPNDPRAGGIPKGHPPLKKFLGLPFMFGKEIIGMVGLANKPDGYNDKTLAELDPFIQTSTIILSGIIRNEMMLEMQKKNERSEKFLQFAISKKADLIVEIDYSTKTFTDFFVFNNNSLVRKPEDFLGKKIDQVFNEENSKIFYDRIEYCIKNGNVEFEFNSEPRFSNKTYKLSAENNGNINDSIKITAAITDITKEKNYEDLISNQQQIIENISENNYIGKVAVDVNNKNVIEHDTDLLEFFNADTISYDSKYLLNIFKEISFECSEKIKQFLKEFNKKTNPNNLLSQENCDIDFGNKLIRIKLINTDEKTIEIKFYDITSSYLLELNNKRLTLKYDLLLDNLHNYVILTDKNDRIIEVNNSLALKFNTSKSFFTGKKITEIVNNIKSEIKEDNETQTEHYVNINGNIYAEIKKSKYYINNDNFYNLYVISDLSEIINTRERLSNTTKTLITIIDNLHYGILFESNNGTILHVNETFNEYFNIKKSPSEIINTQCIDLLKNLASAFKKPEEVFGRVQEILAEKKPVFNDLVEFSTDKKYYRTFVPIIDNEKYIGHLWIYNDITEKLEQERKIVENEQRLNLAIAASNDGFWDWDLVKDTIYFSPRWKSMFGYKDSEIENTMESWEKLIIPDDKETALQLVNRFIKGDISEFNVKQRFVHKNKSIVHVLSKAVVIRDNTGKATRIVGAHTDITSTIDNEINLLQQKEKAERSEKIMQQFISNISHEMRTPLNSIIGYVNLLKNTELNEKQSEYLNDLKFSSIGLLKLINDILDLGKIQSGTLSIEEETYSFKENLKYVINQISTRASEKKLQLECNIDEISHSLIVESDKIRLNQILINILTNAVKFTEKGYVKLSVKIVEQKNENIKVKFNIEDSGIGIAKEKQKLIFDDFFQVNSNRSYTEGVGLGLSIVKKIITLLGGTINLQSTLGLGSNFEIVLPFKISDKNQSETNISDSEFENIFSTNEQENLKNINVLVVEDNPMSLKVFQEFLNTHNIPHESAINGEEAVKLVSQKNYDIIFMDYQMPVLDGIEATKIIRHLPDIKKSTIPIIALSAAVLKDDRTKFFECGMNDIIEKPYSEERVFSVIKSNVNLKKNINQENEIKKGNDFKYFDIAYFRKRNMNKKMVSELIEMYEKHVIEISNQFLPKQEINHFEQIRFTNHDLANSFLALGITSLYHESKKMSELLSSKNTSKEDKIKQWYNIIALMNDSLTEIPYIINEL